MARAGKRTTRGVPTSRFAADLPPAQRTKLETLAVRLNVSMKDVLIRLLDVATIPDPSKGERLCVCNGERVVAVIAWS